MTQALQTPAGAARRRALQAIAAVSASLALPGPSAAKTPGEVEVHQALREATLQGLNGKSRKLSEFLGRPLIINVWASWCGPCRAEMASLERLAWSGSAAGFTIIGISTDDDPRAAQAWLRASNATLSHFIDHQLELENMLGATQIPLTVLVDGKGRVVAKVYGAKAWDAPESVRLIERAFKAPAKPTPR
jgi:thiol-disulfide isomerase/thioredoxin